jgi:hypothetical protein
VRHGLGSSWNDFGATRKVGCHREVVDFCRGPKARKSDLAFQLVLFVRLSADDSTT